MTIIVSERETQHKTHEIMTITVLQFIIICIEIAILSGIITKETLNYLGRKSDKRESILRQTRI